MYILFLIFYVNLDFKKKIISIISILTFSFLFIYNTPALKSKFYNHIFSPFFNEKHNEVKNFKERIIRENQHVRHYYTAINIFKENILFGKGFKSFRIESFKEKYKIYKDLTFGSSHPHQFHFEILSELGIFGYFLIISNLLFLVIQNVKMRLNFISFSALIFIISSMIPILPSGSFFTSYGASIFWLNYAFLLKRKM